MPKKKHKKIHELPALPDLSYKVPYFKSLINNGNVNAFLLTIRKGEGTLGDKGYYTFVGGPKFKDLSHHPHVKFPKYNSTAAGAYQFVYSTWRNDAEKLKLKDFGKENQTIAAIYETYTHKNALQNILNGDIELAISKLNGDWMSLPGAKHDKINRYSQDLTDALKFYQKNGGILHGTAKNTLQNGLSLSDPIKQLHKMSTALDKYSLPFGAVDKTRTQVPAMLPVKKVMKYSDGALNALKKIGTIPDSQSTGAIPYTSQINALPDGSDSISNIRKSNVKRQVLKAHTNPVDIFKIPYPVLRPDQIMKNIFRNYPGVKSKWSLPDFYNNNMNYPGDAPYGLPPTDNREIKRPLFLRLLGNAETKDNNGMVNNTEGNETNGRKTHIHINTPLIGQLTIHAGNAKDGINDLRAKVEEALLQVLSSSGSMA